YLTMGNAQNEKHSAAYDGFNRILGKLYDGTLGKLNHWYEHNLAFFLKHRLDLVVGLFIATILTFGIAGQRVKISPDDEDDDAQFRIQVEVGPEISYDDIKDYFSAAEAVVEANKNDFFLDGYLMVNYRGGGRLEGWLVDDLPKGETPKTIAKRVAEALPKRAGFELFYGEEDTTDEKQTLSTFPVMLQGEDAQELEVVGNQIKDIILRVPGVIGLQKGEDKAPNELALVIDRDRLSAANVNPQTLAGVVGYALRGRSLPKYNDEGREVPVRLRFEEEDREQLNDLSSFYVPTQDGDLTTVGALTDSKMLSTPSGISRRNKKVTYRMTFELEKDNKEVQATLAHFISNYNLPEGMSFSEDAGRRSDEDVQNMLKAALLSILFIYLLMGFLFESFVLPLSILLTIPLAIIGVLWSHIIAGRDLDMLGMVGMILLVGVVVNNGIVLIDYVHRLRDEGSDRTSALLLAARRRFRPIVMTALTTIIGMIPLTVSKTSTIGLSYKSFGLTLIGGMTTATILTLLVVPVFYTLFDDLRNFVVGFIVRYIKKTKGSGPVLGEVSRAQ
ncbi:MAG: efflux RND transporter permease subunit, partial [Acidobacteria bacterium]|nr:efflux RND transporter permease subunit [Acidobacteriota bacterium]